MELELGARICVRLGAQVVVSWAQLPQSPRSSPGSQLFSPESIRTVFGILPLSICVGASAPWPTWPCCEMSIHHLATPHIRQLSNWARRRRVEIALVLVFVSCSRCRILSSCGC